MGVVLTKLIKIVIEEEGVCLFAAMSDNPELETLKKCSDLFRAQSLNLPASQLATMLLTLTTQDDVAHAT